MGRSAALSLQNAKAKLEMKKEGDL